MNRAESTKASSRGVAPGSISARPDWAMSWLQPFSMTHSRSPREKLRGTSCPGSSAAAAAFAEMSSAVASREVTPRLPERAGVSADARKVIGLIGIDARGAAPNRSPSTLWKYSRIRKPPTSARTPDSGWGGSFGRPSGSRPLLLVLLVDFLEVGVDDVVLLRPAGRAGAALGMIAAALVCGLRGGVHRLAELHRRLHQVGGARLDDLGVVARERLAQRLDRSLDALLVGLLDLVAVLLDRLLGRVDQRLAVILRFDELAALLVLGGMRLGVLDHLVDVGLGQAAGGLDADLLLLRRRLVLRRDVDDAVGVDVEGDLDLRHAARRRRDAHQVELAEQLVVRGHLALALEDPDRDCVLVVLRGREHLALLRRDGGVAIDEPREHAAERLDAERQRRHVEEQHVLDVALEHAGLDSGADRHHLVRIDALVGLLAEEGLHHLLDLRHAGHAADEDDLVDLARREAGVL